MSLRPAPWAESGPRLLGTVVARLPSAGPSNGAAAVASCPRDAALAAGLAATVAGWPGASRGLGRNAADRDEASDSGGLLDQWAPGDEADDGSCGGGCARLLTTDLADRVASALVRSAATRLREAALAAGADLCAEGGTLAWFEAAGWADRTRCLGEDARRSAASLAACLWPLPRVGGADSAACGLASSGERALLACGGWRPRGGVLPCLDRARVAACLCLLAGEPAAASPHGAAWPPRGSARARRYHRIAQARHPLSRRLPGVAVEGRRFLAAVARSLHV